MVSNVKCESCGMPIENGPYCEHCVTKSGELQSFDERFARMVQFQARQNPTAERSDIEAQTLAYMATMPAWRNHPKVKGKAARR